MTNLYDFLRRIQSAYFESVPGGFYKISPEDMEFIEQYLKEPEAMIQFKARKTGEERDGMPVYAQDYAIKGEPYEIFTLLTEAAMQNPVFCDMLFAAYGFMTEHVGKCEDCQANLEKAREDFQNQVFDYTFKPHK